ncbi:S49 family peptidase [Brucella intermedia]|uniref:S49 family peptidase n=1 Tax=Brucella intermedia TaxID=94625 RepID=UPI00209AD6E0|nr:S49 family peptidase [Brucella intermedia]MCO7736459.1 S49 family peptidase [Brucella intermedia]WLF99133.1 S49 family peptidase [Brucella intermedia]
MKFEHILTAFEAEPWAIQREKLAVLADVLAARVAGDKLVTPEFAAAVSDARAKEIAETDGKVAVIPVYGVLADRMDLFSAMSGGTSYAGIKRQLHKALSNEDVKAVVLDIDSPGGSVPGTDELATEIRKLRGGEKPIIAQVNSLAASAAYWIASSADEIVVTPSGRAGSIGVYTAHDDISAALEKAGVKRTYISAGKHKVEGNETEPLGKDTLAYIQDSVNRSYGRFLQSVADGRGVTKSKVEDGFGQGRMFYSEALIDRGMADRIATLDETLARLGANTEPEYVRRVKASNAAKAEAAQLLANKMASGEEITKREFENGIRGLISLSNSEAERAASLYFKERQGEPDADAENAAVSAALERLLAETRTFTI